MADHTGKYHDLTFNALVKALRLANDGCGFMMLLALPPEGRLSVGRSSL